jgi:hypothetical protein
MELRRNWFRDKNPRSGFLTNLLGVVMGILLTFGVNSLWQKQEEKKKTREILILVRNELEVNKQWFKTREQKMIKDIYVYQKILEIKSNWKSIPQDTLDAYIFRTQYLHFSPLTTSAWQIFQNSEMIQKMTNKELVIRLRECYFWINKMEEMLMTEYETPKKKAIAPEIDRYKYFDAVMNNKESVFFYYMTITTDSWNIFPFVDAIIDYTLSLLDQYGDFRYDMDEKEKAFEEFVYARLDSISQKNDTIGNGNNN